MGERLLRTLIIAPHMDDEAISCGGIIQARKAAGGEVGVLAIYGRKYNYGDGPQGTNEEVADFYAAKSVLGYDWLTPCLFDEGEPAQVGYYEALRVVEKHLKHFDPHEVVGPAYDDLNQDHRFLHHVLGIALRPVNLGSVVRVLEFIALDSSLRQPTYFVPLTEHQLDTKLKAFAAYRREARGGTSPRAPVNVIAQARVWGAACGASFAEAYRLRFAREDDAGGDHGQLRVHRHEPDAVSGKNGALD